MRIKMELTEPLRKEFISSLQRLSGSINNVLETNIYDYSLISNIHNTYIEYCAAFKSIDIFSDVELNTKIKLPKLLFKANWTGEATLKEVLLFKRFAKRDVRFERRIKEMLEDINVNLKLIYIYLKSGSIDNSDVYLNIIKNKISNQPIIYKKKRRKELITSISIAAFLFITFILFTFINTDIKYLFRKTELGHVFSCVFDLNDFKFSVPQEYKSSCLITWNENAIYQNGKFIRRNVRKSSHVYGKNVITIKINDYSNEYIFYKENSWAYNKFNICVYNDKSLLWIDNDLQKR